MLAASSVQLILYLMFAAWPLLVKTEVLLHSDDGVLALGETTGQGHHRKKREVTKTIQGFNKEQKLAILQRHNHLRALAKASNMLKMDWDPQLETLAQNYAAQCVFKHNRNRYNVAGFDGVGENLYAGTASFDPASVVQILYDEIKDYNYATGTCKPGEVCGHYTQVVWASSRAVGCGVKYCEHLKETRFTSGYLVVCNYGPSGNYVGEKPYATGQPCSKCPKETKFCNQGLCALRPQIGSDLGFAQIPASENSSPLNQPFVFTTILSLFVMAVQLEH